MLHTGTAKVPGEIALVDDGVVQRQAAIQVDAAIDGEVGESRTAQGDACESATGDKGRTIRTDDGAANNVPADGATSKERDIQYVACVAEGSCQGQHATSAVNRSQRRVRVVVRQHQRTAGKINWTRAAP